MGMYRRKAYAQKVSKDLSPRLVDVSQLDLGQWSAIDSPRFPHVSFTGTDQNLIVYSVPLLMTNLVQCTFCTLKTAQC